MPKYKAIARGYDGVKVREEGEVFEFEGKPGKWMEALEAPKPDAKEGKEAKEHLDIAKPAKAHESAKGKGPKLHVSDSDVI